MFDVAIVGAGIAGASLATALGRRGVRVLVIERDLRPPAHLFVGELLQPGGLASLRDLGLGACVEGIDAQPVRGFAVLTEGDGQALSYPRRRGEHNVAGCSFHHARFVERLRDAAMAEPTVEVVEGTVVGLSEEGGFVSGLRWRDREGCEREARARLTVAADGRASRMRRQLANGQGVKRLSHSVGLLLRDGSLPFPEHGNVFLSRPAPMLSYRIARDAVRVLVDVPGELPGTRDGRLAAYLLETVAPQIAECMRGAFVDAVTSEPLRVMPNLSLVARPLRRPGSVLIGDAFNMRHPLTGSGMTVALNDARLLVELLADHPFDSPAELERRIERYYVERKPLSVTVDVLSSALYRIFCADDAGLESLRDAVLRYWRLGGVAVSGPMSLLSGLSPKPGLLLMHYLAVALTGVGHSLLPGRNRWGVPVVGGGELRDASQLAIAAMRTMKPHVRRVLATAGVSA
ncbi:MAG: FAD-dependent monooxygenase [Myxococcales bacterium]|nr:FAD-dependent monooxygenase [Myxococcales bacterium]